MTRTTPPPSVDLEREVPGIAEFARPTTRLHPRPGEPTARDSHIGGPLLWPADEAWPRCARQKDLPEGSGIPERPVAEVAIAQLYARDVPSLPFPPGKDLLQVLWCANDHDEPEYGFAPAVDVFWRNSAEVRRVLSNPPKPEIAEEDWYFPAPCVVDPEVVTEYPYHEVLPEQLAKAVDQIRPDGAYQYLLSVAPGCKTGGWVSWAATDLIPMNCTECDSSMELLLTIDGSEWDAGSEARWRPVEDVDDNNTDLDEETEERSSQAPTSLMIKDALRIFYCPKDISHPIQQDMQ